MTRARDTADRRRALVATVPERMAESGAVQKRRNGGRDGLFEAYDDEMALRLGHTRRTVEPSATRIARLREGDA
ncbi:hypothetical protein [Streptomyces sp. NPDC019224]|uniref:hypothetical protein n=1 Tax=Streptomyces sp. NPDC019224 TaxID=3154484 RepID=UPI0033CDD29B